MKLVRDFGLVMKFSVFNNVIIWKKERNNNLLNKF